MFFYLFISSDEYQTPATKCTKLRLLPSHCSPIDLCPCEDRDSVSLMCTIRKKLVFFLYFNITSLRQNTPQFTLITCDTCTHTFTIYSRSEGTSSVNGFGFSLLDRGATPYCLQPQKTTWMGLNSQLVTDKSPGLNSCCIWLFLVTDLCVSETGDELGASREMGKEKSQLSWLSCFQNELCALALVQYSCNFFFVSFLNDDFWLDDVKTPGGQSAYHPQEIKRTKWSCIICEYRTRFYIHKVVLVSSVTPDYWSLERVLLARISFRFDFLM